jgi:hypothetical protein
LTCLGKEKKFACQFSLKLVLFVPYEVSIPVDGSDPRNAALRPFQFLSLSLEPGVKSEVVQLHGDSVVARDGYTLLENVLPGDICRFCFRTAGIDPSEHTGMNRIDGRSISFSPLPRTYQFPILE